MTAYLDPRAVVGEAMTRLTDEQRQTLEAFCADGYWRTVDRAAIRAALAEIEAHRARENAAAHVSAEIAALRADRDRYKEEATHQARQVIMVCDQRDAAEKERDALRADAARLDWLEEKQADIMRFTGDHALYNGVIHRKIEVEWYDEKGILTYAGGGTLREAIDAAMDDLRAFVKVANEAADALDAKDAEIARLRADAARYRWLRDVVCQHRDGRFWVKRRNALLRKAADEIDRLWNGRHAALMNNQTLRADNARLREALQGLLDVFDPVARNVTLAGAAALNDAKRAITAARSAMGANDGTQGEQR